MSHRLRIVFALVAMGIAVIVFGHTLSQRAAEKQAERATKIMAEGAGAAIDVLLERPEIGEGE